MREAHLRDLIAVFDSGSVRAAARKLGLSQAAVSKNLSALERSLGVPLLVRNPHGVEPTEYGRVVLRRARVVDTELRRLQEELEGLAGGRGGCVSVGLSATAEALLLGTAFKRFRTLYPDVLVSVTGGRSSTTIAALREGRIDFAVGPAPEGDAAAATDLHFERLMSSDFAVVARADHPLAHAASLAELAGAQWVVALRPPERVPVLTEAFREQGLAAPVIAAHCDSSSALVHLLLSTDLVTLASGAALRGFCRPGLLVELPLRLALPDVVQQVITSASRPLTAAARALADEFRRASRRHRA
jgi:LysR family transcriptional regulator, regulator of abg operon